MKYYIPDLLDAFPPDAKEVSAPDMDKLREDVAKRLAAERPAQKRPRRFGKTLLIAAAAAALLSVTALAAAFGGFDWLRDEVEPEFIDAVEPVEQSVTDEGIRFSVIAAQKFEDTALVYFSMTDVNGLGRITEESSLVLSGNFINNNVSLVYYDADKQTAVYEGRFGTFESIGVTAIFNNQYMIEPTQIDANLLDKYLNGERIGESEFTNFQTTPDEWLTPGYVADIPGMDGAYVSAIGDNGRMLAVQYCTPIGYDGGASIDYSTVLDLFLMDADGNHIQPYLPFYVSNPHLVEGMWTVERYFKVDAETLAGCTLWFEGSTCETVIDGDWTIDVDYPNAEGLCRVTADVEYAGETFADTEIIISPIGATVKYTPDAWSTPRELTVVTDTDEILLWKRSDGFFMSPVIIDPAAVTEIRIGDTVIELN